MSDPGALEAYERLLEERKAQAEAIKGAGGDLDEYDSTAHATDHPLFNFSKDVLG